MVNKFLLTAQNNTAKLINLILAILESKLKNKVRNLNEILY